MMSKYRYGLVSLKISDIDPATGLAAAGTEKELKDDVYRDTFDVTEEDGTTTDHFSEMNVDPEISFNEDGAMNLMMEVMDTSVDNLALLKGGEVVVDVEGKRIWSKPKANIQIEKHIEIETQDGYKMIIPRGKVMATINNKVRRNGIGLIKVKIRPLNPLVDGLAAFDMVEPAPPAPAV